MNALPLLLLGLLVNAAQAEQEDADDRTSRSPNGKWEYRVIDSAPFIVKAGSKDVAVELPGADSSLTGESGRLLWAQDSRRFAFNYRAGGRYRTCAAYELVGATWKPLPDFEEKAEAVGKAIASAKVQQIKRLGLPVDAHQRRIDDTWRAQRWIDNDTLELFAYSESTVMKKDEDIEPIWGGIVFRIRCDNRGGWKIISTRKVTASELDKLQSEESAER